MEDVNIQYKCGEDTILHHVQMAKVFEDSKTFVDMKLRFPKEVIEEKFRHLKDKTQENLRIFVKENFECENLEPYSPLDWKDLDFSHIKDKEHRKFAVNLNRLWKDLGRKIDSNHDDLRSSAFNLPNPVIVPGGRFREVYYWDTYWILRGLYTCQMFETARGMIENLIYLLKKQGYVPNGGRKYYTRSQPPLLAHMVWDYYQQTKNTAWLKEQVEHLQTEWNYWSEHHSVKVNDKILFMYRNKDEQPRPESYREDFELAQTLANQQDRLQLYKELRTGAESGWDYSSRWFDDPEDQNCDLKDTKIMSIVPVDLNAFLYRAAKIIANFYHIIGNEKMALSMEKEGNNLLDAIETLLWNSEEGIWLDFDIRTNKHRNYFSASCLTPLWAKACRSELLVTRGKQAMKYLEKSRVLGFPGGVPTTLLNSGQQWDFPNIWPPLEHIIVKGLCTSGYKPAIDVALRLAKQTVDRNMNIFNKTGHMFEKYNCIDPEKGGSGGEYQVQIGFGWSNGVTLDFLYLLQLEETM